ncbi:MAG TPA: hypothetical protein VHE30_03350 [Polyangiaceae bacterium]|nr:hypothetical protein [Polyangiaceae bacterium]
MDRKRAWERLASCAAGLAVLAGCSRTGLVDLGRGRTPDETTTPGVDAGTDPPVVTDAGPDAQVLLDSGTPPVTTSKPPPTRVPNCTPSEEICNGKDDDCDGQVDEDLPSIPCAGGGDRYCVAGRMSACPTRCDACVPGSERVCFLSYCDFWAVQTCAADGKSFGVCREHRVPAECKAVASAHKDSPELEQCCIDNGYCCHDEHDLDNDGNREEMLGNCDEVSCTE